VGPVTLFVTKSLHFCKLITAIGSDCAEISLSLRPTMVCSLSQTGRLSGRLSRTQTTHETGYTQDHGKGTGRGSFGESVPITAGYRGSRG